MVAWFLCGGLAVVVWRLAAEVRRLRAAEAQAWRALGSLHKQIEEFDPDWRDSEPGPGWPRLPG